MPCTVISRLAAAVLFAVSSTAGASSSNLAPRFLPVPVLGLRLPLDRLNLDKFPEDLRAKCDQIADDERYTVHMWTFAKAKDAASTYYILAGYYKRRNPAPDRRLYDLWDNGGVFTIAGNNCGGDDAGDAFGTPDPNAENDGNVPNAILRELARDLAVQTVRAIGGPEKLRAEIKNQRIDLNSLPQELQEAFAPYFSK